MQVLFALLAITIPLEPGSTTNLEVVTTAQAAMKYMPEVPEGFYQPGLDETIYIFARHGENEYNAEPQRYDGRTLNGKLTLKGHQQAKAAGLVLAQRVKSIDHVMINRMVRTNETAQGILQAFVDQTPSIDTDNENLLERSIGSFEGCYLNDPAYARLRDLDIEVSNDPNLSFREKLDYVIDEQFETFGSAGRRASKVLLEKSIDLKGRIVLVVSHSGTMRGLYWLLCSKLGFYVPYGSFRPQNGAFMVIRAKDNELDLLETKNIDIAPIK